MSETPPSGAESSLLRGVEHGDLGAAAMHVLANGSVALAISAGTDDWVRARKSASDPLNEDIAFVHLEPRRWTLAVADGHSGVEASHRLIGHLAAHVETYPDHPDRQVSWWRDASAEIGDVGDAGTTLLVAIVHHRDRTIGGVSYGDSRAWRYRARARLRSLARPNHHFVRPGDRYAWHPDHARTFEIDWRDGDLLLLHTDGLTECCYRRPEFSVDEQDIRAACDEMEGQAEGVARRLLELALTGVRGYPGGQDNVALIAARLGGAGR